MASLLLLGLASSGRAAEGIVKVRESALNELAAAVLPLSFSQRAAPFDLPWCDEIARMELNSLSFRIRAGSLVEVSGSAAGTWCGLQAGAAFSTNMILSYDVDARAARAQFMPGVAAVSVRLPEWFVILAWIHWIPVPATIRFPVLIDLGPSLGSIPPIPLDATALTLQTPRGPRSFGLVGRNVRLLNQDGYLELRGDLGLR